MKNNIIEVAVTAALVVLAVLVLNPSHLIMPDMVLTGLLAGLLAFFCLFAVFVVRERVRDEREMNHRALSGRVAFLIGSAVLVFGIIAEGMKHAVDQWLVIALVAMIVGKLATRIYSDYWL